MSEHYTKNTLEATAWCAKCQKQTQHRVDGGRLGPCLEQHQNSRSQKQIADQARKARKARQSELFPDLFPPGS